MDIHIHRFSVDIHGYIHIYRRLSYADATFKFLQNTAVQKRPPSPPPEKKHDADIPLFELLKSKHTLGLIYYFS